jgi:CRP-like cAMP-binding protein
MSKRTKILGTAAALLKKEMNNEAIKQLDIYGLLTKDEQKLLSAAASVETVPRDKVLFHEGERGDRIGLLTAGKLLLVQPVAGYEDVVLHVLRPGEVFGETLLAEASPVYEYRAESATESTVVFVPLPLFADIARQNPEVAFLLLRMALQRRQVAERRLLDLRYQTVEFRIRKLLREIMETEGRPLKNGEIELPMRLPHRLIAQLCVTTRQSVTILLLELKKQRILNYNRHHVIIRRPDSL